VRARFKICCIRDEAELALAVEAGAAAVGLVSAMPSGPGPIDDDAIARLLRRVPPGVTSFLLTSLTDPDRLAAQHRRLPANALQLVDRLEPGAHGALRRALPGVGLVQVIHVEGRSAVGEAVALAPAVDALLLDSGRPGAAVRELGGTGRVHDWAISRRIVSAVPVPVYLAGGLNAGNVAGAVAAVRPFGVDVCTGVRTDGALDPARLRAFTSALRGTEPTDRTTGGSGAGSTGA
jgi:phosphoribosylanthranilate isomerase